ncbi:alanine racemase [Streptomyces sp. NPDC006368]|uniref:diaminopimelate decarboxylase family protein n=1 Tax=Streptomyces sp. NPDC006368 TaxID=3156760 RepID=UPI0033B13F9A
MSGDHERLTSLAERHSTPFHVLDCARLDEAADRLDGVLATMGRPTRVYYSVKTNYLPFILRRLAARGMGADVVSGYELDAALAAGFDPADIVFNGPVKTEEELATAVRHGVRVHIDGEQEIEALERLAARAGHEVEVGIRISSGVPVSTSSDPSYRAQAATAALRSRFGWPAGSAELARIVGAIADSPHLRLTAVHAHLSSQIVHEDLLLRALERVVHEAAGLHRRFGLDEVNIGGGFGVPGIRRPRTGPLTALWTLQGGTPVPDEEPFLDIARVLPAVDRLLERSGLRGVRLACEPGRWLVSDAMSMVTRVMSRKELPDARWLILDGGNNVAPWAGTGEVHRMEPIGRTYSSRHSTWSVSGPLCYENDIHATAVDLPDDIGVGDLLCLRDTGAYSLGRSNNFIRTRAAVVAVDGESETVVWRAESGADVFLLADPAPDLDPAPAGRAATAAAPAAGTGAPAGETRVAAATTAVTPGGASSLMATPAAAGAVAPEGTPHGPAR